MPKPTKAKPKKERRLNVDLLCKMAGKETEREVRKVVLATLLLGFYMGLAILVYGTLEPDWTSIDAAYFAMMSMSTVGYGDISPSNGSSRGFTLFMIFFGIVGVFTRVANAIGATD